MQRALYCDRTALIGIAAGQIQNTLTLFYPVSYTHLNELNLEIAVELLKYAGLNITTAKNGLEGLDKFKAAPPGTYALILMDIQMPVMNGLEAAKAIRALPVKDAQTVPIVAMTANAFPEDIAATLQAGMNEHLSKPIDLEQFHSILQKWCQ